MKHWPLYDLRVRTPRLELRLPRDTELDALAETAAAGVHPPDEMPFTVPWSDAPPETVARRVIQHHWLGLASWQPDDWRLSLAVFAGGRPLGLQDVSGHGFAVSRHVETGSWLGRAHQGNRYGVEMRAAVLALAFAGLDALTAGSAAHTDNAASNAVSHRLGYATNGRTFTEIQGRRVEDVRYLIDREAWAAHRTVETEITGLEPCLPLLGLA
ncbi:GNAT family protein [Actinocorallia sp. A-T 12471]|uniref:GNAT family N-acetyltransferase n=1 Tax=Actinocorallia sp. A-T 12471 TaxID=3089813 RepID=UPI0029CF4C52|nr:GNAT family protein [Actinocorallia sp. A-T 12471]MDX6743558.1 GNAT family protein [Actinocorallia sp. A-T 12471]